MQQSKTFLSEAEFLEFERKSEGKTMPFVWNQFANKRTGKHSLHLLRYFSDLRQTRIFRWPIWYCINPTLIIEILSSSTANYDKGTKFELYRDIPSLKEYLTVDSTKVHIEQFVKNDNSTWTLQESKSISDSFTMAHIDVSVSVADWYDGIEFK